MPKRRLRDDEREGLHSVYRGNVSAVYAFFSYSVDVHTAEDLTAATFERVIGSWRSFDSSKANVRTWVLVIAGNILKDHRRRQKFRVGPSLDEHPALAAHLVASNPADEWLDLNAFRTWLSDLSAREREVLGLRYGADLSTEEIARILDLSLANVHQISSRALRRLRESCREMESSPRRGDDAGLSCNAS